MNENENPVNEGFPYLRIRGAAEAIDFYSTIFGARERFRLSEPNGRIGHAELEIGNIVLMLSDEYPEYGILAPQNAMPSGSAIHLHVRNVDELAKRAVEAGAKMLREPSDQFYGERSCTIRDPFNHEWMLGHEIEKVTPEEIQRRFTAFFEDA
jgi:PhnB protein